MSLRPEDKLLFTCTRQNFKEVHRQQVLAIAQHNPIGWDDIYTTALAHGVAPLVYANLRRCAGLALNIPKGILEQFHACFLRNMTIKERKADNLKNALDYFQARSIKVMLIKGAALDIFVYEHPYLTMPIDIDVVLHIRREELTDEEQKEIMRRMHGLSIEYDYFEHHDAIINGMLAINFHRIWAEATKIDFRGQVAYVTAPEDMLLLACINSCRKRFFRLKSLCDIAEIINRYRDLDWEKVVKRAQAYDCHIIVFTALLVTNMTLGCELPEGVLGSLKVNPARAAIIGSLIGWIRRRMPLSALYPFSGRMIFGRGVNLSVLLPYATYHWYQVGHKIKEIYQAQQLQD